MTATPAEIDWLAWRAGVGTPEAGTTLGASQVAAIFAEAAGHPAFGGGEAVYNARWGMAAANTIDDDTQFMFDIGHASEPVILRRFLSRRGLPFRPQAAQMRLELPSVPWLRGSLDYPPVDVPGMGRFIADAKSHLERNAKKFMTRNGAPVMPLVYAAQAACYAVMSEAAGTHIDYIALAITSLGEAQYYERVARLNDPISDYLDPEDGPTPETPDGPMSVRQVGLAAIDYARQWRTQYLLGDSPPQPPPNTDAEARWLMARPRADNARPATAEEATHIAAYLTARAAGQAAKTAQAEAQRALLLSLNETGHARVYSPAGSVSAKKVFTVTPPK